MKKVSMLLMLTLTAAMISGCRGANNSEHTYSELTTEIVQEETGTSSQTTNSSIQEDISFESVTIDSQNPIDNAVSELLAEADTTNKINRAYEQFLNMWKAEMSKAADLCKQNGVSKYSDSEYDSILNKAQEAYDNTLNADGGSSAVAAAMYESGKLYRQGTYYYIALYKQKTGNEYQFYLRNN